MQITFDTDKLSSADLALLQAIIDRARPSAPAEPPRAATEVAAVEPSFNDVKRKASELAMAVLRSQGRDVVAAALESVGAKKVGDIKDAETMQALIEKLEAR